MYGMPEFFIRTHEYAFHQIGTYSILKGQPFMNQIKTKPAQNQAMDCCKMLASFLVVFNHVNFPGELNGFLNCLCLFAVPMFFATTGYFNLNATTSQLKRRIWHIVKLNIAADMVHIFWTCIYTEMKGGSTIAYLRAAVPDLNELLWWIILHKNSFLGHLWYLISVVSCYLVYLGYVTFFEGKEVNRKPLYIGGLMMFVGYFAMAIVLPVAGVQSGGGVLQWDDFVTRPLGDRLIISLIPKTKIIRF